MPWLKQGSLAALAVFAAACATYSSTPAGDVNVAVSPPPVVTITARDYTFDPIADIPSGVVEIHLLNAGPDLHHATLFKLADGKTAADLASALKNPGPPPQWAMPVASPNAPAPGSYSNVITTLTPGNYAVFCFVETHGPPHFVKGMYRDFKVVQSGNSAVEPAADMKLSLFDYNFLFSGPLTAGDHVVHATNTASQGHEIELVQLAPGKTVNDMIAWIGGPMTTPPPGRPVGGIILMQPGGDGLFRVTLTKGNYAAICFLPDAKDGKPHFMHGMLAQYTVN